MWVCAVDGARPHSRPLWSVWLPEGLGFSTGSPVLGRACDGGLVTATTEDGAAPVILEGTAIRARDPDLLGRFALAVTEKYDWLTEASEDGMVDAEGNAGPVFILRPLLAFGWGQDMAAPTRWRFA